VERRRRLHGSGYLLPERIRVDRRAALDDDAELEAGEPDDEPVPCVLELHPAISTAPVRAAMMDATLLDTTGSFPESASLYLGRRLIEDVARRRRARRAPLRGSLTGNPSCVIGSQSRLECGCPAAGNLINTVYSATDSFPHKRRQPMLTPRAPSM
jgi:hypothetical protein